MSDDTTVLPSEPAPQSSGRKRTAIIAGTSVVVAGVLAAGAYGYMKLSGGGPQPAEAFPADTLAYFSIDLDPSAGQKIEAIKMLRKFPSLKDDVKGEDLRKSVVEKALEAGNCDLDYDKQIEPWLGDRFDAAAVDVKGELQPVFSVQVKDEAKAKKGIAEIFKCGDETAAVRFVNDYAVIAETDEIATSVADGAEKKSLADDSSYQHWTDEAGDRGLVNLYASQAGTKKLFEELKKDRGADASLDAAADQLSKFEGLAATVRLADSGVELATSLGSNAALGDSHPQALELAKSLPKDTGLALALSPGAGTIDKAFEQLSSSTEAETAIKQAESEFGISLPGDLKTLLGKGIALSVSGDIPDLQTLSGPQDLDAGLKIAADPADVKTVVAKLEKAAGMPLSTLGLSQQDAKDTYVLASNDAYGKKLTEKGALGDNERFADVVPDEGDAAAVFFLDFNGGWFDSVEKMVDDMGAPAEVRDVVENLKTLKALGFSAWADGSTSHTKLRLALD